MPKSYKKDLTGTLFGRLTVLSWNQDVSEVKPHNYWDVVCECGETRVIRQQDLLSGNTTSCGCINKERVREANRKPNEFRFLNKDVVKIKANNCDEEFLISAEDLERVLVIGWNMQSGRILGRFQGQNVLLYRYIMDVIDNPDVIIDHVDGDPTNNTRENLRISDSVGNGRNKKLLSNNSSGVTGVSFHSASGKWRADIKIEGKQKYLGHFIDFEDAVKARKDAEAKYYGVFSYDASQEIAQQNRIALGLPDTI